jgi:hypothetical protein
VGVFYIVDNRTREETIDMAINIKLAMVLITIGLTAGALTAYAAPASHSQSDVIRFADGKVVGSSHLVRTDSGISATLRTSELPAGYAVTTWWAIFNNPEACDEECDGPDLFDPDVEGSFGYLAGQVIGGSGKGNFGGHLSAGDTSQAVMGPGLLDARKAVIQIDVHTHGEKIPGLVESQISTFLGGCRIDEWVGLLDQLGITEDELPLRGEPGPNICATIQGAVHQPQ